MNKPLRTAEEKTKQEHRLKSSVTKAKKAMHECNGTLADKIALKANVKACESALHDFKLNYFAY